MIEKPNYMEKELEVKHICDKCKYEIYYGDTYVFIDGRVSKTYCLDCAEVLVAGVDD